MADEPASQPQPEEHMSQQVDHQHPPQHHLRAHSEAEAAAGIVPAHGISINFPDGGPYASRPYPVKHMSAPAPQYHSPIRHHRRAPSKSKGVKETLNARSHYGSGDDDGASVHRINQYIIKQEIGRGSFGAVHLAADQYGNEYAVKEFSKSRLRKRAQSNLLRKPNQGRRPGHLAAGLGFNSPLHRLSSSDRVQQQEQGSNNSLELIKEEIAIMKKLNHNNLVNLIEVLDDPQEDSLYMVLEMCKKGVVMKVGLDERAEPYEEEACRCWFRDMILGIEYLHAQGIIHRDIKPDNCLITHDDVLKIVDFGVSEMFEKASEMATAKSAGSPAFMPPELCVARHGQVSGKAADIWSMGVTLYCLRYGHIPFEKGGMLEMYDAIRNNEIPIENESNEHFEDLMRRILEKDPEKRITMEAIREHPWVTLNGTDPLLSAEENCADLLDPPTEAEMDHAITGNMAYLMVVMKAVNQFKHLLHRKRGQKYAQPSILGNERDGGRLVAPPTAIPRDRAGRSVDTDDRRPTDTVLASCGVHRDVEVDDQLNKLPREFDRTRIDPAEVDIGAHAMLRPGETEAHYQQRREAELHQLRLRHPSDPKLHRGMSTTELHSSEGQSAAGKGEHSVVSRSGTFPLFDDHAKGHAHDPMLDTLFLDIGANNDDNNAKQPADWQGDVEHDPEHPIVVSESPPAVEGNFYEQAYQDEMKRIVEKRGESARMFMTRRVEHRDDLRKHDAVVDKNKIAGNVGKGGGGGFAALVRQAKERREQAAQEGHGGEESGPTSEEKGGGDEVKATSKESSEESEEPALLAPKFDGGGDQPTANGSLTQEPEPVEDDVLPVSDAAVKEQAQAHAQQDAAEMVAGMPGGFPGSGGVAED